MMRESDLEAQFTKAEQPTCNANGINFCQCYATPDVIFGGARRLSFLFVFSREYCYEKYRACM